MQLEHRNEILQSRASAPVNHAAEFLILGTAAKREIAAQNPRELINEIKNNSIPTPEGLYLSKNQAGKLSVYCDGDYTEKKINEALDLLYDQNPIAFRAAKG